MNLFTKNGFLVAQLCLTLCDPWDCSPPGSSVHRILQERTLEWVAISFFNLIRIIIHIFKMYNIQNNSHFLPVYFGPVFFFLNLKSLKTTGKNACTYFTEV